MAYNYIRATSKLGAVNIFFVSKDQIRVATHPESDNNSPQNTQLIYRNVPYRVAQNFAFNPEKQEFEAITYGRDGNTMLFVSDPSIDSDYYKLRTLFATRLDAPFAKDPTSAAKNALFDALVSAVATWFRANKEMIFREMAERAKNEKIGHIHRLEKSLQDKQKEIIQIESELSNARAELNNL